MGCCISKPLICTILIIGLDNAGKTSILHKIENEKPTQNPKPTVSFTKTEIERDNMKITFVDVSGAEQGRDLWKHYYKPTSAIIWVVDSSDPKRIDNDGNYPNENTAVYELDRLLKDVDITREAPLLVFANKQDKIGALSDKEIERRLKLNEVKSRPWLVTKCTAVGSSNDVEEGIAWICQALKNQIDN